MPTAIAQRRVRAASVDIVLRLLGVRAKIAMGAVTLVFACALLVPSVGFARIVEFGSPLRGAATRTTNGLKYKGINTPYGRGVVHTAHYGVDTALWNVAVASGSPSAPAAGQVTEVKLEGCAVRAAEGPAPLRQIHFQALAPQPGGGAKVELTSQSFEIPVCGRHGAGTRRVSVYRPQGLCVDRGDFVAFNDEGGYVEGSYRAGVPYRVIGHTDGSRMDSFMLAGGTGNGALLNPSILAPADGFAVNEHQELLLRATLATGRNAVSYCRHGISG